MGKKMLTVYRIILVRELVKGDGCCRELFAHSDQRINSNKKKNKGWVCEPLFQSCCNKSALPLLFQPDYLVKCTVDCMSLVLFSTRCDYR